MENCFDKLLFVRTLPCWLTDRVGCVQVPFQSTVLIHHYIDVCASVQYIFFHSISATITRNGVHEMQVDKTIPGF